MGGEGRREGLLLLLLHVQERRMVRVEVEGPQLLLLLLLRERREVAVEGELVLRQRRVVARVEEGGAPVGKLLRWRRKLLLVVAVRRRRLLLLRVGHRRRVLVGRLPVHSPVERSARRRLPRGNASSRAPKQP